MTVLRPKYITFDCYGTLTWFRPGETAAPLMADRIAAERMPEFLRDFMWYRFDEVERRAPPVWVARVGERPLPVPALRAPSGVSSSGIRDAIASGTPARALLPERVAAYVERHGLYGARA